MNKTTLASLPSGSFLMLVLFIFVLASSVAVAWQAHRNRKLLNELYTEYKTRDKAHAEWGRLVLEQSTWTAYGRIERLAREQLHMRVPEPAEVQTVTP